MMTGSHKTNPWIRANHYDPNSRIRLFCLPYAGGTASIFRYWPDSLPPTLAVLPIQLPGRGSLFQDPPFTHLAPLLEALVEVVRPHLNIPYAIFGHSMGALIGFELARELRRRHGSIPAHLYVASYPAPRLPKPLPPIAHLPDAEFLAELRRLGGTPQEVLDNRDLIEMYLPLLRSDLSITETYAYSPGAPLSCPITALGGLDDPFVDRRGLAAWGEQTSSFFTVNMFTGNHFFIHEERESLLKVITNTLSSIT